MTTNEKILALIGHLKIDTQDVVSGVASHEAARLIRERLAPPAQGLSAEAMDDLRKLYGHKPSAAMIEYTRQIVVLYLADKDELAKLERLPEDRDPNAPVQTEY